MSTARLSLFLIPLVLIACTEDVAPNMPEYQGSTGGQSAAVQDQANSGGNDPASGETDTQNASGGASAGSGGGSSTGITPSLGGATSDPSASGGTSIGGSASGGATTGGASSGGTATGGTSTGGVTTGGTATGGASTGGTGTGGSATGGTSSGGATTGGAETGGEASGAAAGTAGSAGDGGDDPTPIVLPHGFAPTTADWDDAVLAYEDWKAVHLQDCGNGVYRVPWENARLDSTVSEGIGYGMLLSVAHDDRAALDGLFAYYNLALDDWGLMHWLRYDCDAHWDTKYNEYPENAASDADLDVAMALIMANCKWGGGYLDDAARVINALEASSIGWDGSVALLQPGDGDFFENNGCINYSYFAPGYYRAFAEVVPDSADFWNQLANDTYVLLDRASDSNTGLVRNWGSSGGGSVSGCSFDASDDYGTDAARTPWRIGVDYLWWGTPEAKGWLDRITNWVLSQSLPELGLWYHIDGTLDAEHANSGAHTAITIGPWAVGAMAHSQEAVDALAAELVGIPTADGNFDAEYFPRSLRALTLLTLTGQFTTCGGGAHVEE